MEPRNSSWWPLSLLHLFLSIAPRLRWLYNVVLVDWPRVLTYFIWVIGIIIFRLIPIKLGISSTNCEIEFGQISFVTSISSRPIGRTWSITLNYGRLIVKWE